MASNLIAMASNRVAISICNGLQPNSNGLPTAWQLVFAMASNLIAMASNRVAISICNGLQPNSNGPQPRGN